LKQLIELEGQHQGEDANEEAVNLKGGLKSRQRGGRSLNDAPKRTGTRG
jgi:hypothetical protein